MIVSLLLRTQSSWEVRNSFVEIEIISLAIFDSFTLALNFFINNGSRFIIQSRFEHLLLLIIPHHLQFPFLVKSSLHQSLMEWSMTISSLLSHFYTSGAEFRFESMLWHIELLGQPLGSNFIFSSHFPFVKILDATCVPSFVVNLRFEGAVLHFIDESVRIMLTFEVEFSVVILRIVLHVSIRFSFSFNFVVSSDVRSASNFTFFIDDLLFWGQGL